MSKADIVPGKYTATAVAAQGTESKEKKTPGISVCFEFEAKPGTVETLWWTGWLTQASQERTFETMALCGIKDIYDENGTFLPKAFENAKEVSITIEDEPFTNQAGNPVSSMKIKWVNPVGGGNFQKLTPDVFKSAFAGIDLKAGLAAAKAKLNLKEETPKQIKNHADGIKRKEEIPF